MWSRCRGQEWQLTAPIGHSRGAAACRGGGGPRALDGPVVAPVDRLVTQRSVCCGPPQPESYWGHVNPVGPRGVYDEAKRFAEALTMAYRRHHGVDTAIVRIFNTYGPRMRPDDGRAIPTFATQALSGAPVTVAGDGSRTRSVCFVDDLVDGILRLLLSEVAGPVNVGDPHELSVLELATVVRRLCDSSSEIVFVPRPEDDPSVRQPDITAREQLGWEPRVGLEAGLRTTLAYFRALSDRSDVRVLPEADQADDRGHLPA